MKAATPQLQEWLQGLRKHVEGSNQGYATLHPRGWPIPFFGDIQTARVLTVGVNPSPTEFAGARWSEVRTEGQWSSRLLNYFTLKEVPANQWFLPWEAALRMLDCSYEDGTAAHLDLSPRATTVMREAPREEFCEMVAQDVGFVFEVLALAPQARLLLATGSIIQPAANSYLAIGEFILQHAERSGFGVRREAEIVKLFSAKNKVSMELEPV